jgi:hypothetical protein
MPTGSDSGKLSECEKTLRSVQARLNYASPEGHRLVSIHDARPLADSLSLDVQGFQLERCGTAVSNFYDQSQVRTLYYREVEQLVRGVTGATKVVAFEHDLRSSASARQRLSWVREPVKVVHDDYTQKSSPERIRLYLGTEANTLLKSHYGLINVWRPIDGPVEESPLAICDARSIREEDLVPTEEGVKHEVYLFNFSPRHRWFYFADMKTTEVLLFKCFDSRCDGRARFTAHTSFDDPQSPPDARPRQSIEVRTIAFFISEGQ